MTTSPLDFFDMRLEVFQKKSFCLWPLSLQNFWFHVSSFELFEFYLMIDEDIVALTEEMAAFDSERHQRWRSQVVLGPLTDDFLRVTPPAPQPTSQAQTVSAPPPQQFVALAPSQLPPTYGHQYAAQAAGIGVLDITVNQARLTKNYGITRMDPFCRVRVGHSVMETPTASNAGKTPRWNKLLRCNVPSGINSMYVEIFDERAFGTEDRIAWCHITLPDSLLNESQIADEWYPLNGKQGEGKEGVVNVIMSFTPVQQPLMQPQQPVMIGGYGQPAMMIPGAQMPIMQQPQQQQVMSQPGAHQQHQQQQPGVLSNPAGVQSVSENDVQSLVDMFPAMPRDTVRSILENCGGHMERAVDTLVSMG